MSADDDKLAELAALYVSGALRAEEQRGFEATLAGSPQARAAVRELEGVLLALTGVAPPEAPPPRIKAELLQTIAATPATVIQRAFDTPWQDTPIAGVQRRVLHVDRERRQLTVLLRMAPGARYPSHVHHGPEECLVLEGDLRVGDQVLHEGDYQFSPAGSQHAEQTSETGCVALVIATLEEAAH